MKSIEEIKNEYAKSKGFDNWKAHREYLNTFHVTVFEGVMSEIMKIYAQKAVNAKLEEAAEKAEAYISQDNKPLVLKQSILSLTESAPKEEKECSRLEHEAGLMHSGECLICGEKS